jgi:sugar O-acyltransferase (sialic acid O-acetyltransferase NeuD family)
MKLSLFGYGGHAREVAQQINQPITFFVDDIYSNEFTKPLSDFDPDYYFMMVAVSDTEERKRIVERLPEKTKYFTFIHPTALILDKNIVIGEGSFIGAYSILTTNIQIGKHAILNRGNHVGHDTIIGDFFSAMPGSIVSGNVLIGDQCYLGTNSTIIEKKNICDQVLVGANGVVIKDIKKSGKYVGVPVKKIS